MRNCEQIIFDLRKKNLHAPKSYSFEVGKMQMKDLLIKVLYWPCFQAKDANEASPRPGWTLLSRLSATVCIGRSPSLAQKLIVSLTCKKLLQAFLIQMSCSWQHATRVQVNLWGHTLLVTTRCPYICQQVRSTCP